MEIKIQTSEDLNRLLEVLAKEIVINISERSYDNAKSRIEPGVCRCAGNQKAALGKVTNG
jgi:hypothetical protein